MTTAPEIRTIVRGSRQMRVLVIRLPRARRLSLARALVRAGYPLWRVRALTRLSTEAIARAMGAGPVVGIWGGLAPALRSAMREVA